MAGKMEDQMRCSFCGKRQNQVQKLIAGPQGTSICDECVEICVEILEEELEYESKDNKPLDEITLYKPEEIKAFLDEYVIGQERAKKVLAVAVYNH